MIQNRALLILDHITLPHEGRCESRLHTLMTPTCSSQSVKLQGKRQRGSVLLACNEPAELHTTLALSTTVREPVHVLRWMTPALHKHLALATLLLPDDEEGQLSVKMQDDAVVVKVTLSGQLHCWRFNASLTQARSCQA